MGAKARWLCGSVDLATAALYAFVGFSVVPGRSRALDVTLGAVVALLAAAGVALLTGASVGRRLARFASWMQIIFAAALIAALVAGAAYLHAIYGAVGKGMAWVSLLVAALLFEFLALWPIIQLRLLRERA